MRIALDGYNVIATLTGTALDFLDLEKEREELNQLLADYRRASSNRLTVVYDGAFAGSGEPRSAAAGGVEIRFSRAGQNADQYLINLARQYGSGLTIVSSDREIARAAEGFGAVVLATADFIGVLLATLQTTVDLDEDEPTGKAKRHLTRKQGNPKRLGKSQRRRKKRLQALWNG
ncbi:MAG TPA: hypothetical protein ENN66_02560 [Proteobacteria bacterium]|nr:hypothetical protein [Pseudomonadota bacterium]